MFERAKQFLSFMMSNWNSDHANIKHASARFATGDGISIFLIMKLKNMIVSLNKYGLIVNNVVGDVATENRLTMKAMATHTICEIIGENIFFTNEQIKYLDLSQEIVFVHTKQNDILIFIGGDMTHIVKRIVNVLESSSKKKKKKLNDDGIKLNLYMLINVLERNAGNMSNPRTDILTDDHFIKEIYSKIIVHLAVQVVSNSMVWLIKDEADMCDWKDSYTSLSTMVRKFGRLVDIFNNFDISNRGEKNGCEMIDCPDHFDI